MDAEKLYGYTTITSLVYRYESEATRIVKQGGLLIPNEPVENGDARMILHPPGYSLLLAALYHGDPPDQSYALLRLIQIAGDSAAAVLIVLIAAELLRTGIAFISGLLIAFSPHLGFYSLWLTPDSLAVVPILIAGYLLIKASKSPRFVTVMLAGIMIGLSCWLRSNALLLAPFLLLLNLIIFKPLSRGLLFSAVLVTTTGLVIMPITIRNCVVFGRFIPLSLGAGVTMLTGLGEYDVEGKFNLPKIDEEVLLREAESYGLPEYSNDLWTPDGVERERARLKQALTVIRSDIPLFMGVMVRRMAYMLRYNDFRPQHRSFNTTLAPAVSEGPSFGHTLDAAGEPILSIPPSVAFVSGTLVSQQAKLSLVQENSLLELQGDGSQTREQFALVPFTVRKNTDYLLNILVLVKSGSIDIRIRNADGRITLGQVTVREPKIKKKKKLKQDVGYVPDTSSLMVREPDRIQVPFASRSEEHAYLTIKNNEFEYPIVQIGQVNLFEIGNTPYTWTTYPRALTRGVQKQLFTTARMRLFMVLGVLLLATGRRYRILAILLAIPAYFLFLQSILHTEYRYILAIHYFLFIIAALAIYYSVMTITMGVNRLLGKRRVSA
jgi:dolichyl-phosphate-mannose-protein mannosyltransferase